VMIALIITNVICLMLETMKECAAYVGYFAAFERISLWIFTAEYVIRLWACNVHPNYRGRIVGRVRFALRPIAVIDLVALLPLFVPLISNDATILRSVRIIRVLRLLKIGRYSESLALVGKAFEKARGIFMLASFLMMVLVVLLSTGIYNLEHDVQPDKYPDIPRSIWWTVITLTSVGYGDVFPITDAGKSLTVCALVVGMGIVGIPSAALGGAFVEIFAEKVRRDAELEQLREQEST
jgi:voltage-gated potassium channel